MSNKVRLVTPKINPDMDGVASAIAYSEIYGADAVFYGRLQPEPMYFLKRLGITVEEIVERNWKEFAIADASSMRGMPAIIEPKRVVEVIDHRAVDVSEVKKTFPNARVQIELVGVAATPVWGRFRREPPKEVACLTYCAIISNTLNLQTKNTLAKMRGNNVQTSPPYPHVEAPE